MLDSKNRRFGLFTTAAVLFSTAFAFTPAGAHTTSEGPATFECAPGFYQVISGQLASLDPANSTYDQLGADQSSYNAMGYRIADGLLYGIRGAQLLQIDANGVVEVVSDLDIPTGAYTGDFGDDGLLHVSRGGRDWHAIDVDTGETTPITQLSGNYGVADVTNVYGIFYGVSATGDLIRIDPVEQTVATVGAVAGLPATSASFGAAWSSAGGNLYVGRNSGQIYQITGYSGDSPTATQVATAPATNSNDGASCSLATAPAGIVDVDGTEPETEPSTPEARQAAEEYEEREQTTYTFPSSGTPDGDSCTTGVDEDRPPRLAFSAEEVTAPTVIYSSGPVPQLNDFDILSGLWTAGSEALQQTHDCGYDYTALLRAEPLRHYRWEATVTAESIQNRGGVIVNQSSPLTRSGASIVDIAEDPSVSGGSILRWGFYDERGYYQSIGWTHIGTSSDSLAFAVEVHETRVEVRIDGEQIAEFEADNAGGLVGLVTSRAAASFDDLRLTALPATAETSAIENGS